jgi:hypothetical protein
VADGINVALRAIDDVWNEVKTGPFIARDLGGKIDRFPDVGYQNAQRLAQLGRELVENFDTLDFAALPGDLAVTAAIARAALHCGPAARNGTGSLSTPQERAGFLCSRRRRTPAALR